jgi:hypothetical protein
MMDNPRPSRRNNVKATLEALIGLSLSARSKNQQPRSKNQEARIQTARNLKPAARLDLDPGIFDPCNLILTS